MSLSYVPLKPILLENPITKVDDVHSYAVLQGGNNVSFKTFTSTSISASSINFSCPPPSNNVICNRSVKFTLPVRVTLSGLLTTNNAGFVPATSLLNPGKDAPRFFPLSSILDNIQAKINGNAVQVQMNDVIQPLQHYNTCTKLKTHEYSSTCSMADQSFNYNDLYGTNKNPLATDGTMIEGTVQPRGAFPFTIVSNPAVVPSLVGTPATAVVDILLNEDLFLSPFFWGSLRHNNQGFYNVTQMDFFFTFLSNAFRLWSHNPVAVTSGANVITSSISSATMIFNSFAAPAFSYAQNYPTLEFEYITPNLLTPEKLSPTRPITYPYFEILRYPTDFPAVTYAQGQVQVSSNNIQLPCIPRRMYIFARPSNIVLQNRCDITDCYLALKQMSIQWANQSVLLSSASQRQLYYMNVKNGSDQSWASWSGLGVNNTGWTGQYGGQGSIMCLEFGSDIQLNVDEAPGKLGQFQLQVNATFQNMNSSGAWDSLPMAMYIVVVHEGTFTIPAMGSATHNIGVISGQDILDAQQQPGISYNSVQRLNGGDFLSGLRSFATKVNEFLKKTKLLSTIGKQVGKVVPGVGIAAEIADKLGYGMSAGVAIQGGKKLTKAQLKSRL